MEYSVDLELICHVLRCLAFKHWGRFWQTGKCEEFDATIFHARIVLGLRREGHPSLSQAYSDLGNFLAGGFEQRGKLEDVEESIDLLRTALILRPKGHPAHPKSLHDLAASFQARFGVHKRVKDLDEAIKLYYAALAFYPQGNPCASFINLAAVLRMRFDQRRQIEDLDKSVELLCFALDLCKEDHSQRSITLNNLANSLLTRFNQEGRPDDLDKAIGFYRTALELCPIGQPGRFLSLNNLAGSLLARYNQHGKPDDLAEANEFLCAALELCPEGHPYSFSSLNNLLATLLTRFGCYGQVEDVNKAIKLAHAAENLCPRGHPDSPIALHNLAQALLIQFGLHGEMMDLEKVVELLSAAVQLLPDCDPHHFILSWSLANALSLRFQHGGRMEDSVKAVNLHRDALKFCPEGHPNRPMLLDTLANSLQTRYKQNGQREDIDEAVTLHLAALELCPEGHPSLFSSSLSCLADSLYARIEKCWSAEDFEECMRLLKVAATHSFSELLVRFCAGRRWAELARKHDHDTTITAYRTTMTLQQNILMTSPTLQTQYDALTGHGNFASLALSAASYAIEKGELEQAIEILEQGRGLLWSQMRGFRSPLDQLAGANKELCNRFRDVSRRLEDLAISSAMLAPGLKGLGSELLLPNMQVQQPSFDEMLNLKRQLIKEQEDIINEIKQVPGFENFLAATPFKVLHRAASEGPVIVINTFVCRSDVLIMLPREDLPIVCIPLDGQFCEDSLVLYFELLITRERFTASSSEYEEKLVEAMKMLWERVVFKVVNKLEELGIAEGSRIWWCTTSMLSALPFHAAGPFQDKDGTSKYLLDKYISSYTPTLGALISARSSGNGGEPTVLVVRDASLPSAKGEIRNIKNCGISTKILSAKASHDAVIKALRETAWVHFVCHGKVDSKPLNSSFKVSDRGLTVLDIIQGNIPNAEFAFLSACHTAEQLPSFAQDEVLHLAAAMQFSGFRSVIGSMWELLDVDGPFFAKTIYEYMWDCDEGEVRYKRAAAGLRQAAVDLKARDGIQTERWVNLIHIGA